MSGFLDFRITAHNSKNVFSKPFDGIGLKFSQLDAKLKRGRFLKFQLNWIKIRALRTKFHSFQSS